MLRPTLRGLALLVLLFNCLHMAHAQCTRLVIAADPAYPPMHWFDGENMQGASVEIAKRVLDDLKIPYLVQFFGPFPRIMKMAENGEVDMVTTLKKTPEREQFLLYPKTPALSNPVAVFQSRQRPFKFQDRADLVGLKGGITRGNKFGDDFDDYIKNSLAVEEANNPESNFSKLAAGHIDYFITGYFAGMAYLLKRGDEDQFLAKTPYVVDTPNYLALTRRGRCADKLDAIDAKLAQLKKSGMLDEIARQSFQKWKTRPVVVER